LGLSDDDQPTPIYRAGASLANVRKSNTFRTDRF
jgi:hypothetical protein